MATKYKLVRDITGAVGNILSFPDYSVDASNVTVQVPFKGNWFVAEFQVMPVYGAISITKVTYVEDIYNAPIIQIFPELKFYKVVKSGSTLEMTQYRNEFDPPATYNINLYELD